MLRPGLKAGKAVIFAAVQQFGREWPQYSLDSAISPAISCLEPGSNLGQKGALPARWDNWMVLWPRG
jgi:hypothetical protein